MKADIDQLKTNCTVSGIRLENVTSLINDVKENLQDVGNMEHRELQDLRNKMERKSDRTNGTIHCTIYFFIALLFLKGGFDVYMMKPDQGKPKNPETAHMGK